MPFVQGLKKRLMGGETAETVFERKLAFDELDTLRAMTAGLRRTTGCKTVMVVAVLDGGRSGRVVGEERIVQGLAQVADSAVPGAPTFLFENVES